LKIVCAHWGGGLPFYALMPEVGKSFTNVFFDTAATVFLYQPQIFEQVSQISLILQPPFSFTSPRFLSR